MYLQHRLYYNFIPGVKAFSGILSRHNSHDTIKQIQRVHHKTDVPAYFTAQPQSPSPI